MSQHSHQQQQLQQRSKHYHMQHHAAPYPPPHLGQHLSQSAAQQQQHHALQQQQQHWYSAHATLTQHQQQQYHHGLHLRDSRHMQHHSLPAPPPPPPGGPGRSSSSSSSATSSSSQQHSHSTHTQSVQHPVPPPPPLGHTMPPHMFTSGYVGGGGTTSSQMPAGGVSLLSSSASASSAASSNASVHYPNESTAAARGSVIASNINSNGSSGGSSAGINSSAAGVIVGRSSGRTAYDLEMINTQHQQQQHSLLSAATRRSSGGYDAFSHSSLYAGPTAAQQQQALTNQRLQHHHQQQQQQQQLQQHHHHHQQQQQHYYHHQRIAPPPLALQQQQQQQHHYHSTTAGQHTSSSHHMNTPSSSSMITNIKSEPMEHITVTPSIQTDEVIIKPEPLDELAYHHKSAPQIENNMFTTTSINEERKQQHYQQQQQQHHHLHHHQRMQQTTLSSSSATLQEQKHHISTPLPPPAHHQHHHSHHQLHPHSHQHPLMHRDRQNHQLHHQQQQQSESHSHTQYHHRQRLPQQSSAAAEIHHQQRHHHHLQQQQQQQQQQQNENNLSQTQQTQHKTTTQQKQTSSSSSSSSASIGENTNITIKTEKKEETQPQQQQPPSLANIKTEPKPPNFPRRKLVQTERSSTLPICQRCKQVFLKRQSYTQHVAQSTCNIVEYDFKCSICPMSFMSNEELQGHAKLHRSNRYFCQKSCGKHYETIEECEQHEFGQHEYDMFKCNICCVCFPKREELFGHLVEHRQQLRYDCCICRICFQTISELEDHYVGNPEFCGKFYDKEAFKALKNFSKPKPQPPPPLTPLSNRSDGLTSFMIKDITSNKIPEKGPSPVKQRKIATAADTPPPTQTQPSRPPPPTSSSSSSAMYDDIPSFTSPLVEVKTEIKVEPDFYPPMDQNDFNPYENDYSNSQDYSQKQNSNQNLSFLQDFHDNASNSTNSTFSLNTTTTAQSNANDSSGLPEEDAVCCVARCGVRKFSSPTLQFFPFPRDEKYLSQWLHNLKMSYDPNIDYSMYRVCGLHFPKRCVARHSLSYWAVPTFNLGHDDVGNLYQNRESSGGFPSGDMARCYMPGCLSQRGETNVKFHSFPRDLKTLIKWCQNSRLPIHSKENRFFCSRHFEEKCFGKFRLKPWAIPTLRLGTVYGKIHDNPNIYQEEKKCFLPFCRRSRSFDCNLSLYRFPRDETLLRRWCYNLRLDPEMYRGKNHKICSSHFVKEALGLRKLNPGAVPTMNLGHNDRFNIYENELYTPPPPPAPPQPTTSSKAQKFAELFKQDMNSASAIYDEVFMSSMVQKFSGTASANNPNLDLGDVCLVPSCKRTRHTHDVTLHTVPKRAEQLKKWCHNLKMDLEKLHKSVRICSAHFESYCIGGCMRPFAVPTLELGHDDTDIYRNPDVIKKLNIRETCCVPSCKRNRDRDHANLHRFPTHPELLQKWCENLQKPVPDGTRLFNDAVCEVHFEERCLRNKRLEKWSIPTLNLGYDDIVHQLPSEEEIAEHWTKTFTPNNGDEQGECCVPSCKRNPQIDDVRLYRPPEDAEQLVKWSHNLQVEVNDLPNLRICNLHFESHCIGKRLLNWAMPTLNLGNRVEHLFENPPPTQVVYYKKKEKALRKIGSSHEGMKWAPRCCLTHCRKTRIYDNIQLFRFPYANRSTLAKWCHNLQLPLVGSSHRRLCSAHFEPSVLTKRCPMNLAVPTLNLNAPPGYKIYQNPARLKAVKVGAQRQCIIESCRKLKIDGVVLFRFPNNRGMLQKWRHNIKHSWPKGKISSQLRVCSDHFEPHSVGGKRLSPGAIPTLKLGHDATDLYPNETRSYFDLEKCAVSGCESRRGDEDIRLFRFPRDDEAVLAKWCNNLKMNPLDCVGIRVCNKHFEEECIGPKLLYKWAVPTLNLGHKDDEVEIIPNPPPEQRSGEFIFKCCVPNCGKTRKYDEAQMNSFPKNMKQFRKWKHNLKLDFLNFKEREKYKICNDHFEPVCVGKTRLNFGALPTINLGHDETEDLYRINPERIRPNLFISQKEIERMERKQLRLEESGLHMDGSDEQQQDDLDPQQGDDTLDPLSMPMECCVDECKAPKTLLREPYDIPETKELRKLWSKVIQKDITDASPIEGKMCGLHYRQFFTELKEDMLAMSEENSDVKLDYGKLLYAYQKSEISLVIKTYQCRVEGCNTNPLNSEVRLYYFPYHKELVKKWSHNTGIIPDEHRRYVNKVCALHFESYCITDTQRLRNWAIPTLNLSHDKSIKLYKNPDLTRIDRRMLGPQIWKCAVANCVNANTSNTQHIRLFSFPTEEKLLAKWCANLKITRRLTPLYKICSLHFEKQCLGSIRVRSWAIPTLNLGHSGDPEYFNRTTIKKEVYEAQPQQNSMERLQLKQVKIKKSLDSLKCYVPTCRRSRLQHGVRFYSVPVNPKMKRKWMHNLQIPSQKSGKVHRFRICNLHFQKRCFEGKQLKPWTLPTMHLGHSEPIFDNPRRLQNPLLIHRCSLQHCPNRNSMDITLRTFVFPKCPEFLEKWSKNLKLEINQCKGRLCPEHFEPDVRGEKKLKTGAVPTLNLGHDDEVPFDNKDLIKLENNEAQTMDDPENNTEDYGDDYDYDDEDDLEDEDVKIDQNEIQADDEEEYECDGALIEYKDEDLYEYDEEEEEDQEYQENEDEEEEEEEEEIDMTKVRIRGTSQHWSSIKMKELRVTLVPISKEELLEISSVSSFERDYRSVTPASSYKDLRRSETPGGSNSLYEGERQRSETPANSTYSQDVLSETPTSMSEAIGQTSNDKEASSGDAPVQNSVPATNTNTTLLDLNDENSSGARIRTDKPINSVAPLCCLKHCGKEKTPEQHLTTYGFPKDPHMLQKWCDNLGLQPEQCIGRLCIDHFELRVIMTRRLRPGAVPTINLGHSQTIKHTNDELFKEKKGAMTTDGEGKGDLKSEQVPAPPPPYTNPKPIGKQSVFRLCCLKHCRRKKLIATENEEKQSTQLFEFPQDPEMRKKWAANLRLSEKECQHKDLALCAKHFENFSLEEGGKKLKPDAIPTLDLGLPKCSSVILNKENEAAKEIKRSDTIIKSKRKSKAKKEPQACCLPHCQRPVDEDTFLLSFPTKSASQLRRWRKNLKMDLKVKRYKNFKICNHHFEPYLFFKQRNLRLGAVPTLNLGHSEPISHNKKKLRRKVRTIPKEKCCVKKCNNQDPTKLFAFPKNSELRRVWSNNLQIDLRDALSSQYKLCGLHFASDSFEVDSDVLKINAVPTLNLGTEQTEDHRVFDKIPLGSDEFKCVVENCLKSATVDRVKLFELPQCKEMLKKWLFNLNLSPDNIDAKKTRICHRHFDRICIRKGSLHPKAVPTRCLKAKTSFYENDEEVYEENYKCCVPQCNYDTLEEAEDQSCRIMYRMPRQREELLRMWLHNLKLPQSENKDEGDYDHLRICEIHFEEEVKVKEHLKPDAVPTLHLGYDQTEDIYRNEVVEKCCIENCQWPGYFCHKLPDTSPETKALWLKHLQLEYVVSIPESICSIHFVSFYERIYENPKTPQDENVKELFETLYSLPELRPFKCCVPNCETGFKLTFKLFQFPSCPQLFQKWLHNTSAELDFKQRTKYRVCARHFEDRCLSEKQLHRWALPTLDLPFNLSLYVNPPEALPSNHENLKHCCVSSCDMDKGPFFKFPSRAFYARKWRHNLDLGAQQSTLNLRVCHRHFEEYCFTRDDQNRIQKLKFWSVPTLNLKRTVGLYNNPKDKQDYFFCCVCKAPQNKPEGLYLFRFPSKLSSFLKWLHNLRLQRDQYRETMRVCIKHFEPGCFNKTLMLLRRRSVPTIGVPCSASELFKTPKRKLTSKCCVASCEGPWPDLNPFPKDSVMLKKWYFNLNIKPRKQDQTEKKREGDETESSRILKICPRHFESYCINAFGLLRPTALPTLNLGHNNKLFKNSRVLNKNVNTKIGKCSLGPNEDNNNKLKSKNLNKVVLKASKFLLNAKIKKEKGMEENIMEGQSQDSEDLDKYQTLEDYRQQNQIRKKLANSTKRIFKKTNSQFGIKIKQEKLDLPSLEVVTSSENMQDLVKETNEKQSFSKVIEQKQNFQKLLKNNLKDFNLKRKNPKNIPIKKETVTENVDSEKETSTNIKLVKNILNRKKKSLCKKEMAANYKASQLQEGFDEEQNILEINQKASNSTKSDFKNTKESEETINTYSENISSPFNLHQNIEVKQEFLLEELYETDALFHIDNQQTSLVYESNNVRDDDDDTLLSYPESLNMPEERPHSSAAQKVKQRRKCSVASCDLNFNNLKNVTYKLPIHSKLTGIWLKHCQEAAASPSEIDTASRKFKLCKDHFEEQCFKEGRLLMGAVPTLYLGPNQIKHLENCSEMLKTFRNHRCLLDECQRSMEIDQIIKIYLPPKDQEEQRSKWLFNLNLEENDVSESQWLCNKHFERRFIYKGKIRHDALPTLLLGSKAKAEKELYKNPEFLTQHQVYAKLRKECCVPTCPNTKYGQDSYRFSPFPKKKDLYEKWLHNLDMEHSSLTRHAYQICWEHFEPICHSNYFLKTGSIPTLKLKRTQDLYKVDETQLQDVDNFALRLKLGVPVLKHKCDHPLCKDLKTTVYDGPKSRELTQLWMPQEEEIENKTESAVTPKEFCDEHFYLLYKQFENRLSLLENQERFSEELSKLKETFDELKSKVKFFGRHCFVPGCKTDLALPEFKERTLYNFPLNAEISQKWRHNCNVDTYTKEKWTEKNYYKICDRHFEPYCFSTRSIFSWALPTLNLPENRSSPIYDIDEDNKVGYTGRCCIRLCPNYEGLKLETKCRLYKFPENPVHRSKWLHNVRIDDFQEEQTKICGLHFRSFYVRRMKALSALAVPTLRLHPHREANEEIYLDIRDLYPKNPTKKEERPRPVKKDNSYESNVNANDHDYCFDEKEDDEKDLDKQEERQQEKIYEYEMGIENPNETDLTTSEQFFEVLPIKQELIEDQYGFEEEDEQVNRSYEEIKREHKKEEVEEYNQRIVYEMPMVIKEEIIDIDECQHQEFDVSFVKEEVIEIDDHNNNDDAVREDYAYTNDLNYYDVSYIQQSESNDNICSISNYGTPLMIADVKSHIFLCCVQKCCNNSETLGVRLYREFPKDSEIFIKWCFNIKIDPRKYQENQYAICSQHFESMCFKDESDLTLHSWAVPTLNLNLPENAFIHQNVVPNEQCIVYGCIQPLQPLHNFPTQLELCQKWISNLKLDLNDFKARTYRICRRHFKSECFDVNLKLKADAMPTVYLGHGEHVLYLNDFELRQNEMDGGLGRRRMDVPTPPAALENSRGSSQGSVVGPMAAARHLISPNDLEDHDSSYFEDFEECNGPEE